MRELENYMVMPRFERRKVYTRHCKDCGCGISPNEDYWAVPNGKLFDVLCKDCMEKRITYAKHDMECDCGRIIKEDDEVFISDDGSCICLDCMDIYKTSDSD